MPPQCHQNRLAKSRQRRVFDINSMLEAVKEKEREKILSRTMGNHQEAFTKAVIHNFSKLIKDARHSFCSKVEGVQLLLKIIGAKLDETGFQIWLTEVLRVKDRDELLTVMEYSPLFSLYPWRLKISQHFRKGVCLQFLESELRNQCS